MVFALKQFHSRNRSNQNIFSYDSSHVHCTVILLLYFGKYRKEEKYFENYKNHSSKTSALPA